MAPWEAACAMMRVRESARLGAFLFVSARASGAPALSIQNSVSLQDAPNVLYRAEVL